jgi:hypothetical protein
MCAIFVGFDRKGAVTTSNVSALLVEHHHSFILDTFLSSRPVFWSLPGNPSGKLLLYFQGGGFSHPVFFPVRYNNKDLLLELRCPSTEATSQGLIQ